jgi:hypothetical protein
MKLYDINGKLVNVDIKQSSYPIKGKSKSILQGKVGEYLQEKYRFEVILEEFVIPSSRLSVDFFIPKQGIVIEIDGVQHDKHVPYFHKDQKVSTKFAGQVKRDINKEQWVLYNNYTMIRINNEEDITKL